MSWRKNQNTETRPKKNEMPYSEWLHDSAPTLHEFFTVIDPQLTTKKGGTLLMFAEDGMWKVCLRDRQTNMSLWLSHEDLGAEFFRVVSSAIDDGKGVWRPPAGSQRRSTQPTTK